MTLTFDIAEIYPNCTIPPFIRSLGSGQLLSLHLSLSFSSPSSLWLSEQPPPYSATWHRACLLAGGQVTVTAPCCPLAAAASLPTRLKCRRTLSCVNGWEESATHFCLQSYLSGHEKPGTLSSSCNKLASGLVALPLRLLLSLS